MRSNKFLFTTILTVGLSLSINSYAKADSSDSHMVVHDERGNVIKNTFANCARTQWASNDDECGAKTTVKTVKYHEFREEDRTAYFEFDKSELMNSEKDKLSTLADALKEMDDITGVSVVGYADRIGEEKYNEALSQRRAKVVEAYLKAHGYLNTTIAKTRWLGESVPVTKCEAGVGREELITCLQADRRVTVEIQYKNEVTKTITSKTNAK